MYSGITLCGSDHQILFVIHIVSPCSQERLQVWNTITYFTERQSFPKSKALIYQCENFSFCGKTVSSFSLIITLIADSELSPASWFSVNSEDVLFAWEVREIHLFIMTQRKQYKDKTVGDTEVRVKCVKWQQVGDIFIVSYFKVLKFFSKTHVSLRPNKLNTFPALKGKKTVLFTCMCSS